MNLTKDDWLKFILLFMGAALTVLGHVFIREWYQPDIRYEVGSWYKSTNLAVTSLRLHNMGGSDAENVTVTALFTEPLADIATGSMAIHFEIIAGGIGQKAVTGQVKRLVPDEAVYIYFAIQASSPWSEHGQFIREIKFNGGMGKTGYPFQWAESHAVLTFLSGLTSLVISIFLFRRELLRLYQFLTHPYAHGSYDE
jgi:hypothetical protein